MVLCITTASPPIRAGAVKRAGSFLFMGPSAAALTAGGVARLLPLSSGLQT